jgi:hypothetical protein
MNCIDWFDELTVVRGVWCGAGCTGTGSGYYVMQRLGAN